TSTVIAVPVNGGSQRPITQTQWNFVSRVLWLHDGSGLILTVLPSYVSVGTQIWFVSYPDGVAQRITNDLNGYETISLGLTTDSKIIATVQEDMTRSISVIEANGQADQARPISNGKYEGMFSLATAPDGRILYLEPAGDSTEIWIMKADGSDRKQLTN